MLRAFLSAVQGERWEALYTVALACGLRRGEALGLRWGDVDLDAGTIAVRNAWIMVGSRPRLEALKTERSRRTLALPAVATASLRAHRTRQLEERLRAGDEWTERGFVFTSYMGSPVGPRNLDRHFKRMLAKAGVSDRRLYDLRHACATLLLVQGVPMRTVMELLGHSTIVLTMNTYTHVVAEVKREAADRMNDLLAASD
jgi:integrase